MNADLLSLVVVGGSGSAMLAGIAAHEHTQAERMRASRVRLSTRYPMNLEAAQVSAAWDGLAGLPYTTELVAEIEAREGSITHSLLVPETSRESVRATLTGVIPSLRISEASSSPTESSTLSLRLFVPASILSTDNAVSASRSLLTGLSGLRANETVVIRWALSPRNAPSRRQSEEPTPREREIAKAWAAKTATPGFRVAGLVLIKAGSISRARELASHIENLLRSRRGLLGGIRVTSDRGGRSLAALPKVRRSSGWLSCAEITPLLGLPQGSDAIACVEVGSKELLVPPGVSRTGRVLFTGRDSHGARPVALSPEAARHHMAVVGPSGVGKSVLLANSILSDIAAGHGGVVIDPKADLIDSILARVPAKDAERIVVLDPGDHRPIPGVALLSGGDPDSRADVLTGTLKSIFAGAWGVRSDFYGRLAIRTLSEVPGASLADMGRLFYDEPFLLSAIARLSDPYLVSSWQGYLALSPAARAEHVQAPMARVMTLLSRPRVRAILASPDPKLDIARLFRERKWLLCSLAPGVISEAGATLVGASLMYSVWAAVEARVTLPPERRHPIFLYVDELATLTNGLPFGFELLAERARGLGAGLTVALQTLGRIGEPTRSALLGNLATFVAFRAAATEAPAVARQLPGLSEADVVALPKFAVAARVATGSGSSIAVVTGSTEPLPPETGQAEIIRDRSAALYGSDPSTPETAAPPPAAEEPSEGLRPGRTGRPA